MKKLSFIAAVAITVAACSPKVLTTPSQADVNRVSSIYPDYTLAQLNEGKALYLAKCSMCHAVKKPTARTAEQWQKIVPNMTKKANKNEQNIDAKTEAEILKYLTTMCVAPSAN